MSKQEAIRNAASAVKAHGLTLPADLDKQIAGLENPQYRVAVVGEYQVGKSTLLTMNTARTRRWRSLTGLTKPARPRRS